MLNNFFQSFNEASRKFDYDYIYIDLIFLTIWISILIKNKKWNPIKFGIFTGIFVYIIDAVWWWNASAGINYPVGTTIREYWIGGTKIPHPVGEFWLIKFGADFMMTFSYSLFIFSWFWIMVDNYRGKLYKEMIKYSVLFFGSWLLTSILSTLLNIDNTTVETIRHMDTQMIIWIVNLIIGYFIVVVVYSTNRFHSKDLKVISYIFLLGCLGSFFMEFPLLITGIRSSGIIFLLFETIILFNQGAPYLYLLLDKIFPLIGKTIKKERLNN
ncbi:MAG: hypothetical protein ACFE8E_06385 [Candidatus Hodarchaeota archaeon]